MAPARWFLPAALLSPLLALAAEPSVVSLDPAGEIAPATPEPSLEAPFTIRAAVRSDATLRSGPDALATALEALPAGAVVAVKPGELRGFHRVRLASGQSGYVASTALDLAGAEPVAEPPPPAPFVVTVHSGSVLPQSAALSSSDRGLFLDASVGWRFDRHFELDLSMGRYGVAADGQFTFQSPGGGTFSQSIHMDATVMPVFATLRAVLPAGPVELSLLGGPGLTRTSARRVIEDSQLGTFVSEDWSAQFALELGAGLAVNVGHGFRLDVQATRTFAATELYADHYRLDSLMVTGGLGWMF